jgi:hypothetical protein
MILISSNDQIIEILCILFVVIIGFIFWIWPDIINNRTEDIVNTTTPDVINNKKEEKLLISESPPIILGKGTSINTDACDYKKKKNTPKLFVLSPGEIKKQAIMTSNELVFFDKLCLNFPSFAIFPQVAMSGIVTPAYSKKDKRFFELFPKFSQKRIDYVVCNPKEKYYVVLIIELDDSTHDNEKKIKSDKDRDDIHRNAGYVTLRFRDSKDENFEEIRKTIKNIQAT